MKIIETGGSAYYGNGEADCFDCWSAGKILLQIGGGEFFRQALESGEIDSLIAAAKKHEREKGHHNVRVYTFERSTESFQRKRSVA